MHTDHTHDIQRGVTHDLILAVCKRQGGRNGNAIPRVNAHRVKVLDGTHDASIVIRVTHDLHLILFPTEQRFLNQHFADRTQRQPTFANGGELRFIVSNTATTSTKSECGTNNHGINANHLLHVMTLRHRVRDITDRNIKSNRANSVLEQLAIFRAADNRCRSANHLHPIPFEYAGLMKRHR